jgi:hypothetical protein
MKKVILFLSFIVAVIVTNAQSSSPRFGTLKNQDNTGRVLTYGLKSYTDATGADSVIVTPAFYQTIYKVALIDSFCFKTPVNTVSFYGDNIKIIATGASGTKVKFNGSSWITAGTAILSSGGRAVIDLVFDGTYWVEANRTVQ